MKKYLRVLRKIYDQLENSTVNWAITGSFGFWLQGLTIKVNDIDIQTDENGAYQIEKSLIEFQVKPVLFSSTDNIQSHFGELNIDGIKIEIMGDIQKKNSNGDWENPINLSQYKKFVKVEEMRIPVLSLDYEYEAYLKLGRYEKAEMLKNWLIKNGHILKKANLKPQASK